MSILNNTASLEALLEQVNNLPEAGTSLPELTNEGVASELFSGKELIGSDGNVITGTMPTVTQATPSITVDSNGLITATATQSYSGYIASGTKTATKQLAFQSAKTITPNTTDQIAVSSGYYTGGNITVKGDSNLVADNIKSGVSIFGVAGTYEGSGGSSGDNLETELIMGTLSGTYENNEVTNITIHAFANCSGLTSVNFPACISIGSSAFFGCDGLTSISFPVCTSINNYAFASCSRLTSVNFPACISIGSGVFSGCSSLTSVNFPVCTRIGSNAFRNCSKLTTLYLTGSSLCTLVNSNAFSSAGITSTTGSIYVNAYLVDSYKTSTNWTYFSNVIYAYGQNNLINFKVYIRGENSTTMEFKAENEMTWAEWCESDYNTSNFYIENGSVCLDSYTLVDSGWNTCYDSDVIINGEMYETI